MRWARSPLWDGCWILSGLPIGLALAFVNVPMNAFLACYLALNGGHLIAPVAMAWSRSDFRQTMLAHKIKYIALPLTIVAVGGICGATVGKTFSVNPMTLAVRVYDWSDYLRPLVFLLPVYFVWNAYHFGMQNYGFLRLYFRDLDRAVAMQVAMFTTLFGLIIIPQLIHQPQVALFFFGLIVFNHQLAAIGLASHVWANRQDRSPLWFAAALIVFGSGLAWLMLHAPVATLMTIIGLRVTAGFVHFLYDRWVYNGSLSYH